MTFSIIQDLPLPISAETLSDFTGNNSAPVLTLVDLAALDQQIKADEIDPAHFLTGSERKKYASYTYPKRRLEWLGGRLAAKQAGINLLQNKLSSDHLDWRIEPDQYGRPFLKSVDGSEVLPPVEISISHSSTLCTSLAIYEKQCGIDIQHTSPAVIRVQEKFCSEEEKKIADSLTTAHDIGMRLTLLWSAKEALRKALGGHPLTGFLDMNLTRTEILADGCWTFSFKINSKNDMPLYQVITFIYQDSGCSLAFG